MKYKNLMLIGTSHIAAESVATVAKAIHEHKPGIVALELDQKRLAALLHPQKAKPSMRDIRRVGVKGWLFSLLGAYVERKLGEKVGVAPGAEMLGAFRAARETGAQVALIDQDIEVTLKRFSQELTWKEKLRMATDAFKGVVLRKQDFAFDLSTVPSQKLISKMIKEVQKRYPNIYRVLVTERNEVMAHRLAHIMLDHPDKMIVAVVGAGHEKEMIQLIKDHIAHHS